MRYRESADLDTSSVQDRRGRGGGLGGGRGLAVGGGGLGLIGVVVLVLFQLLSGGGGGTGAGLGGLAGLGEGETADNSQLPPSAISSIVHLNSWKPGTARASFSTSRGGVKLPGHQLAREARTLLVAPQGFSAQ